MAIQVFDLVMVVAAAMVIGAAAGGMAVTLRWRARTKEAAMIQASISALREALPEAVASGLVLAAGDGSGPQLSAQRSYLRKLPGAAPLPEAERSAREDFAMKVRGIAQDIGVLSDAYCAGPANDAPDPAKLGPVLGRWEDRLVSVADELDGAGGDDDESEGESE